MNLNVIHKLNDQIETIILPVAGLSSRDRILKSIQKEVVAPLEILKEDFKGDKGTFQFIYTAKRRLILVGVGENQNFPDVLKSFRLLSYKHKSSLKGAIAIDFTKGKSDSLAKIVEAAINGLILGTYDIAKYKSNKEDAHPLSEDKKVHLLLEKGMEESLSGAIQLGQGIGETQTRILDLVNAPSNKKTAQVLGHWALDSGERFQYKVRVWDKKQIEKEGLGALLAVNKGSTEPPVFIVMEYKGMPDSDTSTPKIGLVGKGVTFDTGGLSLKPSSNMHYMKSDMGGAAAVLGTMEVAAKLKLPVHLIGIVPATDNSIGSSAIKPSDIIHSYSGKTIEVIDTDAEGRLILSDGIAYMIKHFLPDVLIDLATLTGSTVRTLGYHAAGLFSNNDQLADQLAVLGEQTGERMWRLPIWDVYQDDMKSDVADIKNFSGRPIAGAITAAKFLQFFTEKHPCWAHLDIAGVAFGDSEFANQKSATAYGIRLLTEFIKQKINQSLLAEESVKSKL